jgi:hypothetical protein
MVTNRDVRRKQTGNRGFFSRFKFYDRWGIQFAAITLANNDWTRHFARFWGGTVETHGVQDRRDSSLAGLVHVAERVFVG